MIRTKIVATMGPAVSTRQTLEALFQAGCDVCRLNFSHGTPEGHLASLQMIREIASKMGEPIAVLGDLCGPKIRLGDVTDYDQTGGIPISAGDELVLQRSPVVGTKRQVDDRHEILASSTYTKIVDDVQVGQRVFIEDGLLRFLCIDKTYNDIRLNCIGGGILKRRKGINLPDTTVNIPSITDEDWRYVDWAIDNDLDYLALSFVRSSSDLELLQRHLNNRASDIHMIAKIEKHEAIMDIENILLNCHGLMVARGDLGVEMDVATVPIHQKELIRRAKAAAKPVIVATQMLQSMVENSSPTRAEVSDVANAIFDGTDAVMLSNETATGKWPTFAVGMMQHIAEVSEAWQSKNEQADPQPVADSGNAMVLSSAVGSAVAQLAKRMDVHLVVVYSQTGATARVFAKQRLSVPVIALSSDVRALRKMSLMFGIKPLLMDPPRSMDELVDRVDHLVREKKLAAEGQRVVIIGGAAFGTPGTRNAIVLHTVGQQFQQSFDSGTIAM